MSASSGVRYLCSQLITLSWQDGATIVNLEEIAVEGAVLESETVLAVGTEVELRCGTAYFEGKITEAEEHDFGCRVTVEFSHRTPWSLELFRPEHLLDLSAIALAAMKPT